MKSVVRALSFGLDCKHVVRVMAIHRVMNVISDGSRLPVVCISGRVVEPPNNLMMY